MKSTDNSKHTSPTKSESGEDIQSAVEATTDEESASKQQDEDSSTTSPKKIGRSTSTASIHSHNLPFAHEHTHTHKDDEAEENATPVKRPRAATNKKAKIKMAKQSRKQNRRR